MLTSTIYDVRIRYAVDGRGAAGVRGLTNDVRQLGREGNRVAGVFSRLGAVVVGAFSVRAGAKALIGFNSTVEDTKLQISGMLALTKKTDLVTQVSRADALYKSLQQRAKTLPGTTAEYANMAGRLTQPIIDAGLGMKDLEDLTVNSVVGAKALGVAWDVAARDIDQALRGQFHSVDVFTGKILGSVGYKGEEGRAKFNAMDAGQRAEVLRGALMQKQLIQLAAAQGDTFSGTLSTFQDTVEQFFGKVGVPLFKAITLELKQWNTWFDKNQYKVDLIATKLAHGLATGFGVVKDAVGFLVDNANTLLTIGKVWAAVKIGGMVGGLLGRGGAGGAGMIGAGFGAGGWFRGHSDRGSEAGGTFFGGGYQHTGPGAGRSKVGLKGAFENAGMLGSSFGVGYALGNMLGFDELGRSVGSSLAMLTGRTDATTEEFDKLMRSSDALDASLRRAAMSNQPAAVQTQTGLSSLYGQQANLARDALRAKLAAESGGGSGAFLALNKALGNLRAAGIGLDDIGKAGGFGAFATGMDAKAAGVAGQTSAAGAVGFLAFQGALTQLTDFQKKTLDTGRAQQELLVYINQNIAKGTAINPANVLDILRNATDDPSGKHKPNMSGKPNVNITIQRIEIASDDPDRFAFVMVDAFRDAVKNPSAAVRAIRES